jgi:predicted N-acetyltransferase YhbS
MSDTLTVAVLDAPPPAFCCGREELDRWLEHHGLQATRSGSARVYLAHRDGQLVGYFALSAGAVEHDSAGIRTRKGMSRHPVPTVLLARLAVAEEAKGQGVGRELVRWAADLTVRAARLVAVRALVVDALDGEVAEFYAKVGFTPNEANPLRLEVLVKDLEALGSAQTAE